MPLTTNLGGRLAIDLRVEAKTTFAFRSQRFHPRERQAKKWSLPTIGPDSTSRRDEKTALPAEVPAESSNPLLQFSIRPQPDDATCGPTCLHAVYSYWNDATSLRQIVSEVGQLPEGGTLAVHLACHALSRGYDATIYTYNLQLFDPTWFDDGTARPRSLGFASVDLSQKLRAQLEHKGDWKLQYATEAYLRYLEMGGRVAMDPLDESLIVRYLLNGQPLLAGLSSTYLYRDTRERPIPRVDGGPSAVADDVAGSPVGHFVVLCGYDMNRRRVRIADPNWPNPMAEDHYYEASLTRVAAALHLGIITYDANLLVITPKESGRDS